MRSNRIRKSAELRPHSSRATFGSLAVIIVLVAGITIALRADPALANHVSCGDTITGSTRLDSDLVNCPNNGIVIGADNITIDLNGHTIDGDGEPFEQCSENEFCDVGVVNDGHAGITIENGSVRQFAVGVLVLRARHNRVLNISSSRHVFFGFVVADSARSVVRGSSGTNNLAPEGDGLGLYGSRHVRILNNSFRNNPQPAIHVADSTDSLIQGNLLSGNTDFGILLEADGNEVRRNRCARNGGGGIVSFGGSRNVIVGNRVVGGFAGIGLEDGRRNVVARNVVVRADRLGINLGLPDSPFGGAHNLVSGNRVLGTGKDGFFVPEKDDHSVLRNNIAKRNGDDGFDVESRSATLTGNRALRNGDLGIEAVRGVNDGGGNIARHNGDPRQCTHLSCR
jgi:large repetitive protein